MNPTGKRWLEFAGQDLQMAELALTGETMKNIKPLIAARTTITFLALLGAMAFSFYACSSSGGSGDNGEPVSIPSNVAEPVLRHTLPASWDENWFASPSVYDLDSDGHKEIIAGRHSVLYVWNDEGVRVWSAAVGQAGGPVIVHGSDRQYASPVVGDLDGDGFGEIAIAYSNKVAVYEHDGSLKTGWPQAFPGTTSDNCEIRSIAAVDLENDGPLEILAQKTNAAPVTMAFRITGATVTGWPQVNNDDCPSCSSYGGYNQNIGAADIDGDGLPEVVSTYDCANIGFMNGDGSPLPANAMFSGTYVNNVPMFHDIQLAILGWGADGKDRDEFTDSPPVFGDVDGDGKKEVIVYSDHELAGEYEIRGNCLWVLNEDLSRASGFGTPLCSDEPLFTTYEDNIVQVAPAPALGQLAGDARPEIVVPSYDGLLRCYSPTGGLLWSYRFDSAGAPFIGASGAVLGDLDNDGVNEVVFTTYSTSENVSHLIILNAAGRQLHRIALSKRGSMSPPTLADTDGDGILDIIVSLKDDLGGGLGGVQIWDVSSAQISTLPWPTGRGNNLRNGNGS